MKLSHSKLSCILTCPMSYYLGYEVGLFKKQTKPALAIGSAVHWGIEHDTEDLSQYWKDNGSFKQGDTYSRDQLLAESMVHGYMKHKDELINRLLTDPKTGEKLELLDETHEVYLTGKLKSNVIEDDHDFVGIIDLLLTTNKGFIIVDYKTSSGYPNWEDYLEQLYRYIFELKCNFPDIPVVKIAIINIRKTGIRQKKNETEFEFLQRMKFEYDVNDDALVNYHEYLPEELNPAFIEDYISNLSKQADMAQMIADNKALHFINYGAAKNQYGKSDWWDIFYKTPGAEVLYVIRDKVWDEDDNCFKDFRDCVAIDMRVIDDDNVLNKFDHFKQHLLETVCTTKEEFFSELAEEHIVDINLLETYWTTFVKEKEVENASEQQQDYEQRVVETNQVKVCDFV